MVTNILGRVGSSTFSTHGVENIQLDCTRGIIRHNGIDVYVMPDGRITQRTYLEIKRVIQMIYTGEVIPNTDTSSIWKSEPNTWNADNNTSVWSSEGFQSVSDNNTSVWSSEGLQSVTYENNLVEVDRAYTPELNFVEVEHLDEINTKGVDRDHCHYEHHHDEHTECVFNMSGTSSQPDSYRWEFHSGLSQSDGLGYDRDRLEGAYSIDRDELLSQYQETSQCDSDWDVSQTSSWIPSLDLSREGSRSPRLMSGWFSPDYSSSLL